MPMGWVAAATAATGLLNNSSARSAASQQADAAQRAQDAQTAQMNQARADNAPFRDTGVLANQRLKQLLGLDSGYQGSDSGSMLKNFSQNDLNNDTVYNNGLQFGLDNGINGINARATQAGNFDSGATLKALTRYANDYGTTKAGDAYSRWKNGQDTAFNRLSGLSGTGQTATSAITNSGMNGTNQMSDLMTQQGNANAAGIVGGANAWGTGLQNYLNYSNNQNQNNMLKQWMNRGSGSNGGISPQEFMGPPSWAANQSYDYPG